MSFFEESLHSFFVGVFFFFLIQKYFPSTYIDIFRVYFTIMLETPKKIWASFWYVLQNSNTVIESNFLFLQISEQMN